MKHGIVRAASLALVIAASAACQTAQSDSGKKTLADTDVAPTSATVETDALELLQRTAAYIRAADVMSVSAVTGFDVVQGDGQKIEFGNTWAATIQRPNRARMTSKRRDGEVLEIIMDGNDLWMYSPTHEVYAHEPQAGDIDASFHHMIEKLDVSTPLSNLFSTEFGSSLAKDLESCYIVGNSSIGEFECIQVAARNDYVDYQVWIDQGETPILRRLVISYREEKGQPQYWAYFREWDFDVKPDSRTFIFQPPAGAERIRLAHVNDGEE